jgi:hypothetical protein
VQGCSGSVMDVYWLSYLWLADMPVGHVSDAPSRVARGHNIRRRRARFIRKRFSGRFYAKNVQDGGGDNRNNE